MTFFTRGEPARNLHRFYVMRLAPTPVWWLGARVLCEVKTINMSEVEAARRTSGAVGSITLQLPDVFFRKLTSDIETAKSQMAAYDADNSIRRIVYIFVNFDDYKHRYADDYFTQIDSFIVAKSMPKSRSSSISNHLIILRPCEVL
jgi:hypothetical protein